MYSDTFWEVRKAHKSTKEMSRRADGQQRMRISKLSCNIVDRVLCEPESSTHSSTTLGIISFFLEKTNSNFRLGIKLQWSMER